MSSEITKFIPIIILLIGCSIFLILYFLSYPPYDKPYQTPNPVKKKNVNYENLADSIANPQIQEIYDLVVEKFK